MSWIVVLRCGHTYKVRDKAFVPKIGSYDRCPVCNAITKVTDTFKHENRLWSSPQNSLR